MEKFHQNSEIDAFFHLFEADVAQNVKGETFQNYSKCMAFVEDLLAFFRSCNFSVSAFTGVLGVRSAGGKEMQYEMLLTL